MKAIFALLVVATLKAVLARWPLAAWLQSSPPWHAALWLVYCGASGWFTVKFMLKEEPPAP